MAGNNNTHQSEPSQFESPPHVTAHTKSDSMDKGYVTEGHGMIELLKLSDMLKGLSVEALETLAEESVQVNTVHI